MILYITPALYNHTFYLERESNCKRHRNTGSLCGGMHNKKGANFQGGKKRVGEEEGSRGGCEVSQRTVSIK